ncbi:hypothetical protein ALC57_11562 [Trachymyrmex cornetzi]|uniref:Uncharacterized protein n=1 Tax=Trachymyrmex cornetzi TaxID=471704 RepID=A0A151J2I0_9HYME|nr:hypothetical protein ALC57_11562 [Trachymyrmex cornetzi]
MYKLKKINYILNKISLSQRNVSDLKMLLNFNQLFVLCHLHARDPAEEDTPRFSMRQCRQYHRMWRGLRSPSSSLVRAASVTHAQRKFFCSLMNQDFMRLRDSHLRNAPQKGNNLSDTLSTTVGLCLYYTSVSPSLSDSSAMPGPGSHKRVRSRGAHVPVSESGGRPSIPALLDRVTVGRGSSQSVGAKCAGVVGYNGSLSREMTADGNRDVEIYRKEIAERVAATNRHDHGLPPSDNSTNRAFKVTCHTGKVTNRLPCNLRISSDRNGKNVRLRWHPSVSYAGFLRLRDLSNRLRSYSMYGHCNTCNLLDKSSRNHRHQNRNNDRGQNNAPRSDRGTVPSVQSRPGRWRLPAARRYGTWHCQGP